MTASILVATSHPPFGELLRISLEDSGQYQVRLVLSAKEARAASGRASFQLAILDSSLSDEPFAALCTDLLRQQPGMRLVVIPPDNNPNHPSLGGLLPHGYLSRPFYLPDLIATVSRLLDERERELNITPGSADSTPSEPHLPHWLQDTLTLTTYLEKEIASTQAVAGVIGLNDPARRAGTLRGWAGAINEEAAEELAGAVFRYWDRGEKTDLMRYLRLATNKKEYLVYAAQITGNMALILAYDTAAPLSQIRPQTRHAAHTLANVPPDSDEDEALPQVGSAAAQKPAAPAATPSSREPRTQPYHISERQNALAPEASADLEEEDAAMEKELINLASLLGSVPPPDPGAAEEPAYTASDWQPEHLDPEQIADFSKSWVNGWEHAGEAAVVPATAEPPAAEESQPAAAHPTVQEEDTQILGKRTQAAPSSVEAAPAAEHAAEDTAAEDTVVEAVASPVVEKEPPDESEETARINAAARTAASSLEPPASPADGNALAKADDWGLVEPPPDTLEDTRPGVISTITQLTQLETTSPALSLLNYTCVLVPRMPGHYLAGELADKLSQWVAQLCVAFGWRLEGIAVRPEYLQWNVQVAPAVSPGNLVRILRQRTSQNIFQAFPTMQADNPSGDFWASGYLIVSGPQPPSAQLLRDYIARTRRRQGVTK